MASLRSSAVLLAVVLAGAGCSAKSSEPSNCEAYATRYTDLIGVDPTRRDTVMNGAKRSCENGRVTAEQTRCVEDASSADAVRACMGLPPVAGGASDVPADVPPPAKITIALAGVEGEGVAPAASASEKQTRWYEDAGKRVQKFCGKLDPPPPSTARTFDVIVTYRSDEHDVDVTAAPESMRACLARHFGSTDLPSGTGIAGNKPITFHVSIAVP